MNYIEWSQEYYNTAEKLNEVITKLKSQRKQATISEKKELDSKIAQYKLYYDECLGISNLLLCRSKGVS